MSGNDVRISALACNICGAPMYPDMKEGGFRCLYCDHIRPFAVTREDFAPAVIFRHKPVEIVEGLLKLGHVAIENKEALEPPPKDERTRRLLPPGLQILLKDKEAFEAIHDPKCHEIICPCCGNRLRSLAVESIFTCPYCNQKFGEREKVTTGKFDERLVVGRRPDLYSRCLPFVLRREAALDRVRALARQFAEDLGEMTPEKILLLGKQSMVAAYIPVHLADLRWKMQVECERGSFYYYQECLNWAWPRSFIYDIYLLDQLAPWDYGELVSLKPACFEGNVQLLAWENLGEWQRKIPNWILQRRSADWLKEAFGLTEIKYRWCSRDLRQHKYAMVLLPIYFLEFASEEGSKLTRIMVNGQTGKAALQVTARRTESTRILEPEKKIVLSPESTMLSPPIPVRYVKSPFLHERLRGEACFALTAQS